MTITSATVEMASNYMSIANTYNQKPVPIKNSKYTTQELSAEQNEKLNEIFDEYDDEDWDKTIH